MTKIYSAQDSLTVGNLHNVLLNEGIESEVRTPFLAAAGGDVPITECWSELWVHDEDADRARELLKAVLASEGEGGESWSCPRCGERVERQFAACWKCGGPDPQGNA